MLFLLSYLSISLHVTSAFWWRTDDYTCFAALLYKCNVLIKHILTILYFFISLLFLTFYFTKSCVWLMMLYAIYHKTFKNSFSAINSHLAHKNNNFKHVKLFITFFYSLKIATRFVLLQTNLLFSFSRVCKQFFSINSLMDH